LSSKLGSIETAGTVEGASSDVPGVGSGPLVGGSGDWATAGLEVRRSRRKNVEIRRAGINFLINWDVFYRSGWF
jgi:hypothetical protein